MDSLIRAFLRKFDNSWMISTLLTLYCYCYPFLSRLVRDNFEQTWKPMSELSIEYKITLQGNPSLPVTAATLYVTVQHKTDMW